MLSVAGITSLLYGLIEAPDYGWASPLVVGPLLAVLAAFAFWERAPPIPC